MGQTQSEHPPIEMIARGLVRRGGSILVCRSLARGYVYLPGGHIEPGEEAAAACEREFAEETGLRIRTGPALLLCEVFFTTSKRRHHEFNIVFHVELEGVDGADLPEIASGEPQIGFEWVERAALVDIDLRPRVIKAWLVSGDDLTPHDATFWMSDREDASPARPD